MKLIIAFTCVHTSMYQTQLISHWKYVRIVVTEFDGKQPLFRLNWDNSISSPRATGTCIY